MAAKDDLIAKLQLELAQAKAGSSTDKPAEDVQMEDGGEPDAKKAKD